MTEIAIAFGSNLGNAHSYIERGLERLSQCVQIDRVSSIYRTEPMYVEDQPDFLNGALTGSTKSGPLGLLADLKRIEKEIGRRRRGRNEPREIDLDLIAFGSLALSSPRLHVPHPRLIERAFVLQPLAEIAPDLIIPGLGPVSRLLSSDALADQRVERLKDAAIPVRLAR